MKRLLVLSITVGMLFLIFSCQRGDGPSKETKLQGATWAEKLGFPKDKRVIILHADDIGMCDEANKSVEPYLLNDQIQSAAIMMPCPYSDDFVKWYKDHPSEDIGLHLTLTSEWQKYRWGPVSDPESVPSLIDEEGFLWHEVPDVVQHASPEDVEKEIRAQIELALSKGIKPSHMDTHMGTLFGSLDYTKVYLKLAMEYNIPAMVMEFNEEIVSRFQEEGYPITDELIKFTQEYTLPKLDDFLAVPGGDSYADKKQKFYQLVQSIKPGLVEIIFHPSVESENLKGITNAWNQRVWEAEIFSDAEVIQFFKDEGVLFTDWKDIMKRYQERI